MRGSFARGALAFGTFFTVLRLARPGRGGAAGGRASLDVAVRREGLLAGAVFRAGAPRRLGVFDLLVGREVRGMGTPQWDTATPRCARMCRTSATSSSGRHGLVTKESQPAPFASSDWPVIAWPVSATTGMARVRSSFFSRR